MTQEVRWFNGRNCVGVGLRYSEEDDIQSIAEWGTRFPNDAGDVLFRSAS